MQPSCGVVEGWGLSPVSNYIGLVEIIKCVHFWTNVTILMSPVHYMHYT